MAHDNHEERRGFLSSGANIALIGFLIIAGYFLVTEHRAHVAAAIPYLAWLLLLACPLMHMVMHGGHGGHGGSRGRDDKASDDRSGTRPASHQH